MTRNNARPQKNKHEQKDKEIVTGQIVAMNEYGDGEIHGYRRTIKVARAVVGDQVNVRLPDSTKQFLYGELINVIKPSEHRVNPECIGFGEGCGGCQWLHFAYTQQLRWKTRILHEMLKQRCGTSIRVNEIIPMDSPYAYRNKMSLRNVNGRFVNMQDFDNTLVSPATCRVETLPNQYARKMLMSLKIPRELLQAHLRGTEEGSIGVHLFVNKISQEIKDFSKTIAAEIKNISGIGAQEKQKYELLYGKNYIEYRGDGLTYNIPLNGFFQTNYIQARRLLDIVLTQLGQCKTQSVLDLYCGCGFFTLPIARRTKRVVGIENNAASTTNATANARANNIDNVQFLTSDTAKGLHNLQKDDWQTVLLDPPRSGCDEPCLREIVRLSPNRIIYISCSPSSLARDLKVLIAGKYSARFIQPIDMFPHTAHMETVVTLDRG